MCGNKKLLGVKSKLYDVRLFKLTFEVFKGTALGRLVKACIIVISGKQIIPLNISHSDCTVEGYFLLYPYMHIVLCYDPIGLSGSRAIVFYLAFLLTNQYESVFENFQIMRKKSKFFSYNQLIIL